MSPIIKLALTLVVLAAIAWKFDISAAVQLLSTISVAPLVSCILLFLCQVCFAGMRLSSVVSVFGHRLAVMTSSRLTLESTFFNQAFVSFLGGDAYRIWQIHRTQVPLSDATSAVVLDRTMGTVVNHLTFVALLPWVLGQIDSIEVRWGLIALAAGGLGGIAVLLLLGLFGRSLPLIGLLPARWRESRIATLLINTAFIGRNILTSPHAAWRVGVLSLLIALSNCLLFFIILRNWDVAVELAVLCALLAPGVLEIAFLPLSVAGWGLREGAVIVGFGALGLGSETGLAASLAFGLLNLVVGLLGGLAWLFSRSWGKAAATKSGNLSRDRRGSTPNVRAN